MKRFQPKISLILYSFYYTPFKTTCQGFGKKKAVDHSTTRKCDTHPLYEERILPPIGLIAPVAINVLLPPLAICIVPKIPVAWMPVTDGFHVDRRTHIVRHRIDVDRRAEDALERHHVAELVNIAVDDVGLLGNRALRQQHDQREQHKQRQDPESHNASPYGGERRTLKG